MSLPRTLSFAAFAVATLLSSWVAAAEPVGPSPPAAGPPLASEAQEPDIEDADRLSISVSSETIWRLFQRAPTPGPGGALVTTNTVAPLHEYASFRVQDIDMPWQADSVDVELAAWGSVVIGEVGDERRVDGDIFTANVRHRVGPFYVALGRLVQAGGAARFCRYDGGSAGVRSPWGLGVDGYAGLTVLPRWSARPGYHLLGSAADADTLLRTPGAIEEPSRDDYWVAGGRLYYAHPWLGQLGASFHEQVDAGELGRRNLGFDLHATPHEAIAATGQVLLDGDIWDVSDARAAVDVYPIADLDLTVEYQHTVPALLLSRQSVLSVFSTDAFDELGGSAGYQLFRWLGLGLSGHAELFDDGETGVRLGARARLDPLGPDRLMVLLSYRRVQEPSNGYHATRAAAGYRVIAPLMLTAESHFYFYDEPVRLTLAGQYPEVSTSWVAATNAEWAFNEAWATLLGGSLSATPYAELDAQAMARLRMNLHWGEL